MAVGSIIVGLFLLVFFGIVVAVFIWWLVVLLEALKIPDQVWDGAGQNKILYVLLMVILGVIGSILYVVVARPQLRAAGAAI